MNKYLICRGSSRIIILTAIITLLSACASTKTYQPLDMDASPLTNLASASAQAASAQTILSQTNAATALAKMSPDQQKNLFEQTTVIPKGFETPSTLNYIGEAVKAARMVALLAGYTFKVYGDAPSQPLMVKIQAKGRSLHDIMQDIATQIGSSATININPLAQLVIFRYTAGQA